MCFDKITNITIVETGDDGGGDVKQCFNDPIVIYIHHPPTHHGHSVKPVTKLGHNYCIVLIVDSFQTTLEIFKSYTNNKVLKHKRFEKSLYSLLSPVTYL